MTLSVHWMQSEMTLSINALIPWTEHSEHTLCASMRYHDGHIVNREMYSHSNCHRAYHRIGRSNRGLRSNCYFLENRDRLESVAFSSSLFRPLCNWREPWSRRYFRSQNDWYWNRRHFGINRLSRSSYLYSWHSTAIWRDTEWQWMRGSFCGSHWNGDDVHHFTSFHVNRQYGDMMWSYSSYT